MAYELIMLGLGTVMALWPGLVSGLGSQRRQRRLLALEAGAPEKYFEERRALQAYRPTPQTLLMWRVIGIVIALAAFGRLVDEHRQQQAEDARAEARVTVPAAAAAVANAATTIARAESLDPVAFAEARSAVRASEAAMARAESAWDKLERRTAP